MEKINETLCTFLTSKQMIEKHWDKLLSMCYIEHYPFESPFMKFIKKNYVFLLFHHCNALYKYKFYFGLSPNIDWKKIWDENKV